MLHEKQSLSEGSEKFTSSEGIKEFQETFSGMFKKISNFRNMLAEYISNALSEKRTVVMAIDYSDDAGLAFDWDILINILMLQKKLTKYWKIEESVS